MRVVVQRVDQASVKVKDRLVGNISKGILIFLGIEKGDNHKDADYLLEKVIHLRIFEDDDGKMNRSLKDISGEMLVVSQFTLLGDCRKGRRPAFTSAEEPERSNLLYSYFIDSAKERIPVVQAGIFQAMMKVELVNDGPVTLLLDSKKLF
ncbi:D-tyrosyl-tRNA(Tyr) deacylase [Syntrophus gentianae]|uniref:D-aminoacyl-tRNA deacylase n=1 Tax=Syntrophus gentianae TaxID=43775 RepID=A0A1H7XFR8_9BACT|nr:D-aminoacyl-tRNA deacylase [Syntrophus gentianae]SEM32646.1 D-tyrosyl-tRNA(Tyr) deacylase [Syntrophus gentianae]